MTASKSILSREGVRWILIGLAVSLLLILTNRENPWGHYGDGSEYQVMLVAFGETGRPWVTEEAWQTYESLRLEGKLPHFKSRERLQTMFPELEVDGGQDFPHFWFYSLLGAIVWKFVAWMGIGPTGAFLILHWLLFMGSGFLIRSLLGWRGFGVYVLLIGVSPALWYINKVHTEFFTVALSLAGMALLIKSHWLYASLCFAALSTQNPGFAIPAALALLPFWKHPLKRRFNLVHVLAFAAVAALVLVHPVYYLVRFGKITPQLVTGAANLSGLQPNTFWIPFLDLNMGLLPNWPLLSLLILIAIFSAIRFKTRPPLGLTFFCVVSSLFLLYTSAKTTNFNHGMTVTVSRYGLWHIFLFFPALLWLSEKWSTRKSWMRRLFIALMVVLGAWQVMNYFPAVYHRYTVHTPLAKAVLRTLPGWYNPHPSIFVTRSTHDANWYGSSDRWAAVFGRKWLVFPHRLPLPAAPPPEGFKYPQFDIRIDTQLLDDKFRITQSGKDFVYFVVDQNDLEDLIMVKGPTIVEGRRDFPLNTEKIEPMLGGTWYGPEAQIRWTGKKAWVDFAGLPERDLTIQVEAESFDQKSCIVYWNGEQVYKGHSMTLSGPIVFHVSKDAVRTVNKLIFSCPKAVSPDSVGFNGDLRVLGLAVHNISIWPTKEPTQKPL